MVFNKYTAFQIWHSSDKSRTRVTASKPVTVVSGNKCVNEDSSHVYHNRNRLFVEMVLPTNQLDNVYIIPHLNDRLENDVRVIAVHDTSVVLKKGSNRTRTVLKSREFMDYVLISYVSSKTM